MKGIRICIFEDNTQLRKSLFNLIDASDGYTCVRCHKGESCLVFPKFLYDKFQIQAFEADTIWNKASSLFLRFQLKTRKGSKMIRSKLQ